MGLLNLRGIISSRTQEKTAMKTLPAALALYLALACSLALAKDNEPILPQRLRWPVPEAACQAVRQQAYLAYREANRPPDARGEAVVIFPNDGNCRYWVFEQISPTLLYISF